MLPPELAGAAVPCHHTVDSVTAQQLTVMKVEVQGNLFVLGSHVTDLCLPCLPWHMLLDGTDEHAPAKCLDVLALLFHDETSHQRLGTVHVALLHTRQI